MEQLLLKLGELGPLVALLIYFMYYFKKELEKKDNKISELVDINHTDEIKTMESLLAINQSLTKLIEKSEIQHSNLTEKLKDIKEEITKIIIK